MPKNSLFCINDNAGQPSWDQEDHDDDITSLQDDDINSLDDYYYGLCLKNGFPNSEIVNMTTGKSGVVV